MDERYDQLVDYVKQGLARGYTEEAIRAVFAQSNYDPGVVDRVFLSARATNKVPHPTSHTGKYLAGMKMGTIAVVIAVVFLVRTTGALQQNLATSGTELQQPTTISSSASPQAQDHSASSGNASTTSSVAPTASSTVTPSTTPVPVATATPIGQKTITSSPSSSPAPGPSSSPSPSPSPPPPPPPVYAYRNGTYTANGNFNTPGGTETIGITLVISNDVITSTSATNGATNSTSIYYTNIFISNYKSLVVGKKLKGLSLSKVSSASLTPIGFNNAANAIRSQAS